MADVATLVFDIDSSQARTAATDLAKVNDAAVRAARGAENLNRTLRDQSGRFRSSVDVTKQYGNEVRSLAAKYNPALNAVYQYQQAQLELNRAVMLGVLTQQQADTTLAGIAAGMQRATTAANGYTTGMRGVNNIQASVGNQFAQLNDIVVTSWGGMNPALIGMQQGMHMVQGFAGQSLPQALGMLRGAFMQLLNPMTLVTIGAVTAGSALIQYAAGFITVANDARTAKERVDDFAASVNAVNTIAKSYSTDGLQSMVDKYGEINAGLLTMIHRQREFAVNAAMADGIAAVRALGDEYTALNGSIDLYARTGRGDLASLTSELDLNKQQVIGLGRAYKDALNAKTPEQLSASIARMNAILNLSAIRVDDLAENLVNAEDAARQLSASAPAANWMNAAISGVNALIGRLGDAVRLNSQLGQTSGNLDWAKSQLGFILPGKDLLGLPEPPSGGVGPASSGGGGGAGGGVEQAQADWDALNEVQYNGVLKNLETLKWGLDQKLISEQEYNRRRSEMLAMEFGTEAQRNLVNLQIELATLNSQFEQKLVAEEQYLMRRQQLQWDYMAQADSANANIMGQELSNWGAHFGQMNSLAGGGYDGLLRMQKSFAAASALINTWLGYTKALAEGPPMTPWMRLAWAGKILAAGMGAVNAIKGGGAGSSASTAQSAAKSEPTRNVLVRLEGDEWLTGMAESIMKEIYEQTGNGRVVVQRDYS